MMRLNFTKILLVFGVVALTSCGGAGSAGGGASSSKAAIPPPLSSKPASAALSTAASSQNSVRSALSSTSSFSSVMTQSSQELSSVMSVSPSSLAVRSTMSVTSRSSGANISASTSSFNALSFGAERYAAGCAVCHGANGAGGVGLSLRKEFTLATLEPSVRRMVVDNNTNCLGVSQNQCVQAISSYILATFATAPVPPSESPFACSLPEPATATDVKRLSKIEYRNTVYDIVAARLGATVANNLVNHPENGVDKLVAMDSHETGFRRMDRKVAFSYVEGWFNFSLKLVDGILPSITTFVGNSCAATPTNKTCMRNFISSAGREFFRKPLTQAQIDFYATSGDYRELLVRMFNSPDFLYHLQIDGPDVAGRADLRQLNAYELAEKLAYTYWQSMPDAQLRADTDSGAIVSDYATVLNRVLNSPKTRAGMDSFYEDWWDASHTPVPNEATTRGLRLVDADPGTANTSLPISFDAVAYRDGAIQEALDLAAYVTWQKTGGTLGDMFTDTHSFARSADLAKAYGVAPWNGNFANLINFPAGQRSGLLTRAAFHIYGSNRSNPILKGARIRKRLLCDTIPVPADNIPPDVKPDPNWTTRELITAQTTSTAGCAGCHKEVLNPAGFATEDFDTLGRFRAMEVFVSLGMTDPNGGLVVNNVFPIIDRQVPANAVVQPRIEGVTDTSLSNSGVMLGQIMAQSPKLHQCFARSFFRHAESRKEDDVGDGCSLRALDQTARNGSLKDAMRSLAERPEFKLRKVSRQ